MMHRLVLLSSHAPPPPGDPHYGRWLTLLRSQLRPHDQLALAHDDLRVPLPSAHDHRLLRFTADGRAVSRGGPELRWGPHASLRDAVGSHAAGWRASGGAVFHLAYDDHGAAASDAQPWPNLAFAPFRAYTRSWSETGEGAAWPWAFGDGDLVVIDTETSGKVPKRHQLLEVAAVRADAAGRVLDQYEARVPLDERLPFEPGALVVNRYHERVARGDWADAVTLIEAMEGLLPFLAHAPAAVGHCLGFDLDVIGAALDACRMPHPVLRDRRDTCVMARRMLQRVGKIPNAKLDTVCTHFGLSNAGHHAALPDAHRCLGVYRGMVALDHPPGDAAASEPQEGRA